MKSALLFTLLAWLIGSVCCAQPTISLEDLTPIPGTQIMTINSNYTSPGPGGENQTWDFSSMTTEMYNPYEYILPDGLPESENFPEATHVFFSDSEGQTYGYQSHQNNKLEEAGFYSVSEFTEALSIYSDPKTILAFPLAYNTVFSDSFAVETVSQYTLNDITTTNTIEQHGFLEAVVDGYGTLITPNNTYQDVMRVRFDSTSELAVYSEDSDTTESQQQRVQHLFVAAGIPYPIVTLSVVTIYIDGIIQNQFTSGSYLGNIVLNVDEPTTAVQQISLFPVPAEDHLNLGIALSEKAVCQLALYSLDGRIVAQWPDQTLLMGENQTTLPLPDLATGSYLLQITSEHFSESRRVMIGK